MTVTLPKLVADFVDSLASAVNTGDTTATLSSAVDSEDVALPSGKYMFTIDRNVVGSKEYIICDLVGTALTGIRSVTVQGAQSSGFALYHRGGATVEITDWGVLYQMLQNMNGTVGFDAGAPLFYDAAPSGLNGNEIPTVDYVLSVVNGGAVTFNQQIITSQTAGENLTANDIVYLKESDQKWWKADADLTATFDEVQLGIAQSTVLANATVSIGLSGAFSTFSGLTLGSKYYLSNTAGAIATTAGTNSVFIGWAITATTLLFNNKYIELPTAGQKNALVGTTGTPSASNPFMTRTDNRAGLEKSVTAGATINGATLPVPVYQNTSDNEYYACDGNDLAALKFQGFAISNATDGVAMNIQTGGIVSGFTGLDEGVSYWLSDTVGTIQNTPGTYPVLVGVAISTTELLIQKGKRYFSGSFTPGVDAGSQAINCGFRPLLMILDVGTTTSTLKATWTPQATVGISATSDGTALNLRCYSGTIAGGEYMTYSFGTLTNTGITVSWAETGTVDSSQVATYEIWGDF